MMTLGVDGQRFTLRTVWWMKLAKKIPQTRDYSTFQRVWIVAPIVAPIAPLCTTTGATILTL